MLSIAASVAATLGAGVAFSATLYHRWQRATEEVRQENIIFEGHKIENKQSTTLKLNKVFALSPERLRTHGVPSYTEQPTTTQHFFTNTKNKPTSDTQAPEKVDAATPGATPSNMKTSDQ